MYVYGGLNENQECISELFSLSLEDFTWNPLGKFIVEGNEIKACGHTAAAYQGKILIFGGLDPVSTTIYNQIFVYNTEDQVWGREEQRRSPRFCGGLLIKAASLILLGGCNLVNRTVPGLEITDIDKLNIDLLG